MNKNRYSSHTKRFFDPPRTVLIKGKEVPIHWDAITAFRFMEYVDSSQEEDTVFLRKVLEIWYPEIPEDTDEALTAAIRFYCGGMDPKDGYYTPAMNPQECKEGIYFGFLKQYGIDLNRDTIHWWVFRRLLESLNGRRESNWTDLKSSELQTVNYLN